MSGGTSSPPPTQSRFRPAPQSPSPPYPAEPVSLLAISHQRSAFSSSGLSGSSFLFGLCGSPNERDQVNQFVYLVCQVSLVHVDQRTTETRAPRNPHTLKKPKRPHERDR